jgi:hypothetical protein
MARCSIGHTGIEEAIPMTTRAQRGAGLIAVGLGAMSFALMSGLTTADGGLDWVGIITVAAGLIVAISGLFTAFRHDSV